MVQEIGLKRKRPAFGDAGRFSIFNQPKPCTKINKAYAKI